MVTAAYIGPRQVVYWLRMPPGHVLLNPFGGEGFFCLASQGSRAARQPWAMSHNAFGVRTEGQRSRPTDRDLSRAAVGKAPVRDRVIVDGHDVALLPRRQHHVTPDNFTHTL